MQTPKERIIELAKEAGLVYNTDIISGEIHKFHRKALYKFAELIEGEIRTAVTKSSEGCDD